MFAFLKSIFPPHFKKWLKVKSGAPDLETSLHCLKSAGFNPSFILDIGAYKGEWTRSVKTIFPEAQVLMIEGQEQKSVLLQAVSDSLDNVSFNINLLGASEKEVEFNKYETASSVLKEHNDVQADIEIRKLCRLDNLVAGTHFSKSQFIKLDTQGYELEILKGGLKTLQSAEAVLMEVSFIDIYIGCPLAHDVLDFMLQNGFVLYDICSLMRRPFDKALYQSDFLFVKENASYRSSKRWS